MSENTITENTPGGGLPSTALLAVNARLRKAAEKLRLTITNYEGYSRGNWSNGEEYGAPKGMWVFTVSPSEPTGDEPDNIVAENITDALRQMESSAEYFYSANDQVEARRQ